MDHLRKKTNEGHYKEKYRRLKEQFINGKNNEYMMTKIRRNLP